MAPVLVVLFFAVAGATGQTPPWPGPDDSPETTKRKISERIKYRFEVIAETEDQDDIVKHRLKLIGEYRYMMAKGNGGDYVKAVASYAAAALSTDPNTSAIPSAIKRLREINAAMVVAAMNDISILPVVELAATHKTNQGVRYYGWLGYRALRTGLLKQDKQVADKMFAVIATSAEREKNPAVLSALLQTLQLEPTKPAGISPQRWSYAAERSLRILRKNWRRWYVRVLAGDYEMSLACGEAVLALKNAVARNIGQKSALSIPLQMVMDLAYCAGQGYSNAITQVEALKEARGQSKPTSAELAAQQTVDANAELLLECEKTVNELTKQKNSRIRQALATGEGAAVQLAVITCTKELAKLGYKVEFRQIAPPGASE